MPQIEKAEKISITLPPEMLASLKARIVDGEYGSTSEAIREAIRMWQHKEEERQAKLERFRQRLDKSANSGADIPMDDVFKRIEIKHNQMIGASKNEKI